MLFFLLGLIFWLTSTISAVFLNLPEARDFWLTSSVGGIPLFHALVLVLLLAGYLLGFNALRYFWAEKRMSVGAMAAYAACAVTLVAIGRSLFAMNEMILSDDVYQWALTQEPAGYGGDELGRVVETGLSNCESVPTPCARVELPNGDVVLASTPRGETLSIGSIVYVLRIEGQITESFWYFRALPFEAADPEMVWRRVGQE